MLHNWHVSRGNSNAGLIGCQVLNGGFDSSEKEIFNIF